MAFSIITNTRKLMNTSTASSPLACLNGMRVISMWWVIIGHTYSFVVSFLGKYQYKGYLKYGSFFCDIPGSRNSVYAVVIICDECLKDKT